MAINITNIRKQADVALQQHLDVVMEKIKQKYHKKIIKELTKEIEELVMETAIEVEMNQNFNDPQDNLIIRVILPDHEYEV
jgi:hypothetical protein